MVGPPKRLIEIFAKESGWQLCILLFAYSLCLVLVAPHPLLWMDEILQVASVRGIRFADLPRSAAGNAGGVPLGYVFTYISLSCLGTSAFAARLPSMVFSVLACGGLFLVARQIGIRRPLLAVGIFALLPIQFRYAIEARPYSAALCISIWATFIILKLDNKIEWRLIALLLMLIVAGLYTQPYSIFIPVGHLMWSLFIRGLTDRRTMWIGITVVSACVLFLPWYSYGVLFWRNEISSSYSPSYSVRDFAVIAREITGAGYIGSIALTLLVISAARHAEKAKTTMWLVCTGVTICGAVLVDIAFGYFFAIRQIIYVIAPLSLLATAGLESISISNGKMWQAGLSTLVALCLYSDIRFVCRPREQWQVSSAQLAEEAKLGACIVFLPESAHVLYSFYWPEAAQHTCPAGAPNRPLIALAVAPGQPSYVTESAKSLFVKHGYITLRERTDFGPQITVYVRRQ